MNKKISQFLSPQKRIAGIDVGESSIKIMEIAGENLDNAQLAHYAIESIPPSIQHNENSIETIEALAEIVKKCWKKSGITTKNVALSLPNSAIFYKKIIVPIFDDDEELTIYLNDKVKEYIPNGVKVEEIVLDYSVLKIDEQNPHEQEVILVLAKKEKMEQKIAIIEAAGLIPTIIDVEQYALQNILRLMKGEDFNKKTFLLLDMSASTLRMLVFKNGELLTTRDTHIGGVNLTKELMNNLDINFIDAEKMKVERNFNEIYDIVEKTFLNNYVSEFISAFKYFISSTNINSIDEIILIGGVAGLPQIDEVFKQAIKESENYQIKTEPYIARPLHSISKSDSIDLHKFSQHESSLFLVTALALRPFLRSF